MSQKRKIGVSDENYAESPALKRKPNSSFNLNDKVLCKHDGDEHYYEAKIIEIGIQKGKYGYTIHYKGWSKRYDEFISDEAAKTRFKPFTEDEAKKEADRVKEARRSASSFEKKTPSRSKATTKIGEASTSSKKGMSVEKTPSIPSGGKDIKYFTPSTVKRIKSVEKIPAKVKAVKIEEDYFPTPSTSKNVKSVEKIPAKVKAVKIEEDYFSTPSTSKNVKSVEEIPSEAVKIEEGYFSTPSTSNVNETPLKARETSSKKTKPKDVFSSLITNDLDDILRVENEHVLKRKFPKLPVKISAEDIIKQFLESKQIKIDDKFENSIQDPSKFKYDNYGLDSIMAFLINLFNAVFPSRLIYDEERLTVDKLLEDELKKQDFFSKEKRYSEVLGLTHLLRLIFCLNDLLVNTVLKSHPAIVNILIKSVKELCEYLDKNIHKYYTGDEYYEIEA